MYAGTKTNLRGFLATLPPEDEANEIVVPANLDPRTIRRGRDLRPRGLVAVLSASLPGARRTRPHR